MERRKKGEGGSERGDEWNDPRGQKDKRANKMSCMNRASLKKKKKRRTRELTVEVG